MVMVLDVVVKIRRFVICLFAFLWVRLAVCWCRLYPCCSLLSVNVGLSLLLVSVCVSVSLSLCWRWCCRCRSGTCRYRTLRTFELYELYLVSWGISYFTNFLSYFLGLRRLRFDAINLLGLRYDDVILFSFLGFTIFRNLFLAFLAYVTVVIAISLSSLGYVTIFRNTIVIVISLSWGSRTLSYFSFLCSVTNLFS